MANPTVRTPSTQPHLEPIDDPALLVERLAWEGWKEGAPSWACTEDDEHAISLLSCGVCDSRLHMAVYHHSELKRWRAFACCPCCGTVSEA